MEDMRRVKYPEFAELWANIPVVEKGKHPPKGHRCPLCFIYVTERDESWNYITWFYDDDFHNYLCGQCYYSIYWAPENFLEGDLDYEKNGIDAILLGKFIISLGPKKIADVFKDVNYVEVI